ncbi:MAG: ABC transporter permease [Bacteroidia bacterium]|nr:ABC transporter permease [Bacteroidia bacterium]
MMGVAYYLPMETNCLLCAPKLGGPWLGTDPLGRDLLVRLLRGWTLSLLIGMGSAALSITLGTAIGLLMGSRPGWIDEMLSIFLQSVWVVPALLWASLLAFVGGKNLLTLFLSIGLSTWTETARLIRIETRRLWGQPFIEAGKALGLPPLRLLLRHVLPVLSSILGVQFLQVFATAILIEAGLGFVGLSVGPPHASLGVLLFEAISWLTLPQGQLQGILSALLLSGTVFVVYSQANYGRNALG